MTYIQKIGRTQCSALALSTGLLISAAPLAAQGFPGGPGQGSEGSFQAEGIVVQGDAQIFRDPDFTEIIIDSEAVVIDWIPDDTAAGGDLLFQPFGTIATFQDNGVVTDFTVLNRILPADLSRRIVFDGTVVSEIQGQVGGTVFFYSPGGILVGNDAVFDVGNLGLTTAEPLTDGNGNFLIDNQVTFQQADPTSSITIDPAAGIFTNNPGSYVAVFAPQIVHQGVISTGGQAALVAGEAGTITFSPDGLFDIQVSVGSDFSQPIENSGIVGGNATADGTGRVFMVAIAKNSAATIAIRGGSALGFDIANSAFMDGDTVVLSAGRNITAGAIDAVEASEGFLSINPSDAGIGAGAVFTSNVVGFASNDADIVALDELTFLGDAQFSARQALVTLGTETASGRIGTLTVGGDLTLLADQTRVGADVGTARLQLSDGTSADIAGNLTIASRGTGDGDGDGRALASRGTLRVGGAGSILSVGGNLVVESSVDLRADPNNLIAQASVAQITADGGGDINVGGVTRIISDAFAGAGGAALAGTSELSTLSGGRFVTGELNMSSDAIAGADVGAGGFDAVAGAVQINALDTGSEITVLGPNTIGDPALGQLDFISSEAIATPGTNGDGGDASASAIDVLAEQGAVLNLPNVPGSPLTVISRATGGSTFVDGGRGGDADIATVSFTSNGGTRDLGRLSILAEALGGSAAVATRDSSGGNAQGASLGLFFSNTDTTIAFDQFRTVAVGGNGSGISGGFGGSATGGSIDIFTDAATLNIASSLNLTSEASGGTAAFIGGSATSSPIEIAAFGSTISVAGSLTGFLNAVGGSSTLDQVFVPNFAFDEQGGAAVSGAARISSLGSQITVQDNLELTSIATGGGAQVNQGGNATSGEVVISLTDTGPTNTVTADAVQLSAFAQGGAIDAANADSFGQGGDATTDRVAVVFDGGANLIDSSVSLLALAEGGDAGELEGFGGNATAGVASLNAFLAGDGTITGNFDSQVQGLGGNAVIGNGGEAQGGANEIINTMGTITIGGSANLVTDLAGGDGANGGNASGAVLQIITDSANIQIGGAVTLESDARGGTGLSLTGGVGDSGTVQTIPINEGFIDLAGDLLLSANGTGGIGAQGGAGVTGSIKIGNIGSNNGLLTVEGNTTLSAQGIGGDAIDSPSGGDGGDGGDGTVGNLTAFASGTNATGAQFLFEGDLMVLSLAQGGTGGNAASVGNGGRGGNAIRGDILALTFDQAGSFTVNGSTTLTTQGLGGDGGNGINGGEGGNADQGNIQFGSIGGAGSFLTITADRTGRGGNGGDATSGIGGRGGDAIAGNIIISAQNNGLSAGNINVFGRNFGGNGGAGPVQGDGGDTQTVATTFRATNTTGSRAAVTIGDIAILSAGVAGDGATPGLAVMGLGNEFTVEGNDVTIASLTIVEQGEAIPVNRMMDFATSQSSIVLRDGSVVIGNYDVTSSTSFAFDVDSNASTFTAGAFNLLVNSVELGPQPNSTANPFALSVTNDLVIETTSGGIITDVGLLAGGQLTLNSFAGITATNLQGASAFLTLGAGGLLDVSTIASPGGLISIEAVDTLNAPGNVDATSVRLRSLQGDVVADAAISIAGDFTADADGSVLLAGISAANVMLDARNGDIADTGGIAATQMVIADAEGSINVLSVAANEVDLVANQGGITASGAIDATGDASLEAGGDVAIEMASASSLNLLSELGDVSAAGALDIAAELEVEAGGAVNLGNVNAQVIQAIAGTDLAIDGQWSALQIDISARQLSLASQAQLDAGSTGTVSINSTNPFGAFLGEGADPAFEGLVLGSDAFAQISAGSLVINALGISRGGGTGDFASIGDLDLSAAANVGTFLFEGEQSLDILGTLQGMSDVTLRADQITLDLGAGGRIDLGRDASTLTIDANTFFAGDTGVLDAIADATTVEELQTLINTPAATPIPEGAISAGTLVLNVTENALIQNTGTQETPAGFVAGSESGLELGLSSPGSEPVVILNGQIVDANGTAITGDEAATAFFTAIGDDPAVLAGSQLNSCDFSGCDGAVPSTPMTPEISDDGDTGELTSSVSASVNGATAASNSAGTTAGSSSASTGESSGSGSSEASASGGEAGESGEDTQTSGVTPSVTVSGAGSANGGEITVENVDDGGGGTNEFAIEEADVDGTSDDASSDASEEEASDEGATEEGTSEESANESEETDEEETEDEASGEEEETEGPTTGPINPPPSIINTNALEQRSTINDPISGSGNPALLDPEVTIDNNAPDGGQ